MEKNNYKEGNLHGICTMYEFDDEPTFTSKTSNYRDGVLHGVVKAFWDKDTLSEISEWKNGKLHGMNSQPEDNDFLRESALLFPSFFFGRAAFNPFVINEKLGSKLIPTTGGYSAQSN